jgi:predicted ArsR family transcriptional regulator
VITFERINMQLGNTPLTIHSMSTVPIMNEKPLIKASREGRKEKEQRILAAVADGLSSAIEVAELLNMPYHTVKTIMASMEADGVLWRYQTVKPGGGKRYMYKLVAGIAQGA